MDGSSIPREKRPNPRQENKTAVPVKTITQP